MFIALFDEGSIGLVGSLEVFVGKEPLEKQDAFEEAFGKVGLVLLEIEEAFDSSEVAFDLEPFV